MQLQFKMIEKTLIVSINGEIDHHTSEEVRNDIDKNIDKYSAKNVILDLSNVNFMDSAGIGVILGRYKKVMAVGGKASIVNKRSQLKRVLEISGIPRICSVYDNIDIALGNM